MSTTTAAAVDFFDATCNSKPEKRVLTNVLQCKLFWRNNNNKVKFYQQLNAMQKLQFLKPNKLLDRWMERQSKSAKYESVA